MVTRGHTCTHDAERVHNRAQAETGCVVMGATQAFF